MNALKSTFQKTFGQNPRSVAAVPGRVNLIGEHIDYTGGTVLPTPIEQHLTVAYAPAPGTVRIRSPRFGATTECDPNAPAQDHWADYVVAAHRKAVSLGFLSGGGSYLVESDIPHGAGVSSSAALVVGVLKAAVSAAGAAVSPREIAIWAQEVERDDIGVPIGIMDQMAVSVGRPGWALALNTLTLETDYVPLPDDYAFPVIHSGITRALADGAYADRRRACEEAQRFLGIEALSLASDEEMRKLDTLSDVVKRRARHAITEHRRVLDAIAALKGSAIEAFGGLMTDSHRSMRDDFEIVPEGMDQMVGFACENGAVGSRLTGGGFGGCFVSCVPLAALDAFVQRIQRRFPDTQLISTLSPLKISEPPVARLAE